MWWEAQGGYGATPLRRTSWGPWPKPRERMDLRVPPETAGHGGARAESSCGGSPLQRAYWNQPWDLSPGGAGKSPLRTHHRVRSSHRAAQRHPRHIGWRLAGHTGAYPRAISRMVVSQTHPKTKDQGPETRDQRPATPPCLPWPLPSASPTPRGWPHGTTSRSSSTSRAGRRQS